MNHQSISRETVLSSNGTVLKRYQPPTLTPPPPPPPPPPPRCEEMVRRGPKRLYNETLDYPEKGTIFATGSLYDPVMKRVRFREPDDDDNDDDADENILEQYYVQLLELLHSGWNPKLASDDFEVLLDLYNEYLKFVDLIRAVIGLLDPSGEGWLTEAKAQVLAKAITHKLGLNDDTRTDDMWEQGRELLKRCPTARVFQWVLVAFVVTPEMLMARMYSFHHLDELSEAQLAEMTHNKVFDDIQQLPFYSTMALLFLPLLITGDWRTVLLTGVDRIKRFRHETRDWYTVLPTHSLQYLTEIDQAVEANYGYVNPIKKAMSASPLLTSPEMLASPERQASPMWLASPVTPASPEIALVRQPTVDASPVSVFLEVDSGGVAVSIQPPSLLTLPTKAPQATKVLPIPKGPKVSKVFKVVKKQRREERRNNGNENKHRNALNKVKVCHECGGIDHLRKNCPQRDNSINDVKCFKCGQRGHYKYQCPNPSKNTPSKPAQILTS